MILDPVLNWLRGNAITIPPLDGAFRPNTRLDDAPGYADIDAVDNLVVFDNHLYASSGRTVYQIDDKGRPERYREFSAPVTAMAASPDNKLAIALDDGRLMIDAGELTLPDSIKCITALAWGADGRLWLANGSADYAASRWASDLMMLGHSGSVWQISPSDEKAQKIASGLAFPYGLLPRGQDVLVTESWRHRLLRIAAADGAISVVADQLPGYPARLAAAGDNGVWLTLFAPRNRLIELVLQEHHYRLDMIRQVAPEYWIAPALSSGHSFLEPLQCGGIKTMGVHKPWSPGRSYGLVVRLSEQCLPQYSYHSRANGHRHGICSALEFNGRLLAASKGGNCIVAVDTLNDSRGADK